MRNLIFTLAVISALVYLGILRSSGWETWFFEKVTTRLDQRGESRQFQWAQALEQLRAQVRDTTDSLDESSLQGQITLLQKRLNELEATAVQIDGHAIVSTDTVPDLADEAEGNNASAVSMDFEKQQSVSLNSAEAEQSYMSRQDRRRELLNLAEGMEIKAMEIEY
jgi:hypothetical protein